FFFYTDTPPSHIYTLSLHDALPISSPTNITLEMYQVCVQLFEQFYDGCSYIRRVSVTLANLVLDMETQLDLFYERSKQKDIGYVDRKSTRLNSSHVSISYAVFCLKK